MDWFINLYSWFGRLAVKLYNISDKIRAWSWLPGVDWIADRFDDAGNIAKDIMDFLIEAYHWTQDRLDVLAEFISQDWVQEWLRDPLKQLGEVWEWFINWVKNVGDFIDEWWEGTKETVQDLINTATEGLSRLQEAWDNFWTDTFPTLVDNIALEEWRKGLIPDITDLIIGKLKDWFPFYDSLSELWNSVAEFIADPFQWLYDRLENFFDRFW